MRRFFFTTQSHILELLRRNDNKFNQSFFKITLVIFYQRRLFRFTRIVRNYYDHAIISDRSYEEIIHVMN